MLRRYSPLICMLLLLLIAWPAAAQDAPALRIEAQALGDGTFRPGSWLPVRVTVRNDGRDVQALVSVQAGSTYETTLDLPGGAHKSITIYTRPTSSFRPSATVRAHVNGAEAAKLDLPLNALSTTTRAIGVLSAQPLAVPLPTKPGLRFQAVPLRPADLPERREGLGLFDVLVIDGAPLGTLAPPQADALAGWVLGGGQLLVGGDQLPTTLAQLPESLRVATPSGPVRDITPALIAPLNVALPATPTQPVGGARPIDGTGADVVGVQQRIGNGQVSVVGWSLSVPQLAQLPPNEVRLWDRVAQLPTLPANMPPEFLNNDARTEQLGYALMQLPTLALPPLGVMAGLLGTYILIIGPGLYLVLRRWDRQAWAWVAVPVATIVFGAGAYGYALRLRGNDIILNQISVLEPLGTQSLVQTLGGVFSPRTQSYTVQSDQDVLFRPLSSQMMGNGSGVSTSSTSHFGQTPAVVKDLKVAQWAMSSFAAEQIVPGSPLQADLTLAGNMLRGEVRNTGPLPITGLVLVQNTRIAHIGDLQPNETRSVELKLDTAAPNMWGEPLSWRILRGESVPNNNNMPSEPLPPPMYMRDAVLNAVLSGPMGMQVPAKPMLLGWMDTSPVPLQLDYDRAQYQHLTLVNMPVVPRYPPNEPIALPRGWLTSTVEASSPNGGQCPTSNGVLGWYAESGVITTTLQLPEDLEDFQIDSATLHRASDGPAPNDTKISVYDWSADAWSDIANMKSSNSTQALDQPARFVGPDGTFQLRTELGDAGNNGGGCMGLDLSLEGRQP